MADRFNTSDHFDIPHVGRVEIGNADERAARRCEAIRLMQEQRERPKLVAALDMTTPETRRDTRWMEFIREQVGRFEAIAGRKRWWQFWR